jgi:hypothetical protein
VAGTTAAQNVAKCPAKTIAARDIVERLDGKEAKATFVELTYDAGQTSQPHRHQGPVFGYVLEGEYEFAIDDQPAKVLKGRGNVLRADRVPAPGVAEPGRGTGQDPCPRHPPATARREIGRTPGAEPRVITGELQGGQNSRS